MRDSSQDSSWRAIVTLAVVALTGFTAAPLFTAKPSASGSVAHAGAEASQASGVPKAISENENAKVSRLWDDPLQAVDALSYKQVPKTTRDDWLRFPRTIKPEEDWPESDKIKHLIFVPIRGQQYKDVAEMRLRTRYAVQAAMASKGFRPLEANRISFRDISFPTLYGDWPESDKVKPGADWYLRIPYEDFFDPKLLPDQGPPKRVRIAYANLDLLEKSLTEQLFRIAQKLAPSDALLSLATPPSTDWLKSILEHESDKSEASGPDSKNRPTLHVFNSQGTGSVDEFKEAPCEQTLQPPRTTFDVGKSPSRRRVSVHQLIEDDSHSVKRIVEELQARSLSIGVEDLIWGGPCKVVLVSDRESAFSQTFRNELTSKFRELFRNTKTNEEILIERFYFRGIAGLRPEDRGSRVFLEAPDAKELSAHAASPGEALSRAIAPDFMPEPFGRAQFDYIARMGEELLLLDRRNRAKRTGTIRAILVVGTEVDDKLALLKVLRPRFPNAIFFSNEMDADYLQPENSALTRNVITFSRYNSEDPGSVFHAEGHPHYLPRFRGSNQVAIVDSIRAALEWDADTEAWPSGRPIRAVNLYEAGIRHWHHLKPPDEAGNRVGIRTLVGGIALLFLFWLYAKLRKVSSKASRLGRLVLWLPSLPDPVYEASDLSKMRGKNLPAEVFARKPLPTAVGLDKILTISFVLAGIAWGIWGEIHRYFVATIVVCVGVAILFWLFYPGVKKHLSLRRLRFSFAALAGTILIGFAFRVAEPMGAYNIGDGFLRFADGVLPLPGVVLRWLASVLAIYFVVQGWQDFSRERDSLTEDFFLDAERGVRGGVWPGKLLYDSHNGKRMVARRFPEKDELDTVSGTSESARNDEADKEVAKAAGKKKQEDPGNEAEEWERYLERSDPRTTGAHIKCILLVVAAIIIATVGMFLAGFPKANVRGGFEEAADAASLFTALFSLSILCVLIGVQIYHCTRFIKAIDEHSKTQLGFEAEETLHLVGRLTGKAGGLLMHPFWVCFVLLCAHFHIFAQWFGLGGLYTMFALALGSLLLLTWWMQRAAHKIKNDNINRLKLQLAEALWMKRLLLQRLDFHHSTDEELIQRQTKAERALHWWKYTIRRLARRQSIPETPRTFQVRKTGTDWESPLLQPDEHPNKRVADHLKKARTKDIRFQEARIERLEQLIKIVEEIREGAFGGLTDNPIFRSALFPVMSYGGIQAIQRLMNG